MVLVSGETGFPHLPAVYGLDYPKTIYENKQIALKLVTETRTLNLLLCNLSLQTSECLYQTLGGNKLLHYPRSDPKRLFL